MNNKKLLSDEDIVQITSAIIDSSQTVDVYRVTSWIANKIGTGEILMNQIWEWFRDNWGEFISQGFSCVIPPWQLGEMLDENDYDNIVALVMLTLANECLTNAGKQWETMEDDKKIQLVTNIVGQHL